MLCKYIIPLRLILIFKHTGPGCLHHSDNAFTVDGLCFAHRFNFARLFDRSDMGNGLMYIPQIYIGVVLFYDFGQYKCLFGLLVLKKPIKVQTNSIGL